MYIYKSTKSEIDIVKKIAMRDISLQSFWRKIHSRGKPASGHLPRGRSAGQGATIFHKADCTTPVASRARDSAVPRLYATKSRGSSGGERG